MTRLPDYPEALRLALACARPLGVVEEVDLDDASGRVLATPVAADRDLPPFDRAQMDGYAVRSAEVGTTTAWPVAHTISAGVSADVDVPPGHCVAIATGAPMPADVDAVIQHELSDRGDPVRFEVDRVEPGRAVHPCGTDARRGDNVLEPGTELRSHHLGIAAAVGAGRLAVARRPRAVVVTSGDEVLAGNAAPAAHEIRNSNGPQSRDLLRRLGADPIRHAHTPDEPGPTHDAVGAALAEADLLVTVGGLSAGERDHFPAAFDAHGVSRGLHRAGIQPGKPVLVGRAPNGTVVVALPGNPVAVLVVGCLFAGPIIRVMLGLDPGLPWRDVEISRPVRPNPNRRAFRPACLDDDGRVHVPAWGGSGDLAHTARTSGVVELPVQDDEVAPGTRARFLEWP